MLKKGIDALIGKIALKTRKENDHLKERILSLEKENLRLLKIIYGYSKDVLTSPYILDDKNGNIIS